MTTYTEHGQRALDQASGRALDRRTTRKISKETSAWLRDRLRLVEYSTIAHQAAEAELIKAELAARANR